MEWGFPVKIKSNNPLEVHEGRILYPDFRIDHTRLIIEIDGGIHFRDSVLDRDCKRDFWLEERGFKVLHITNKDVLSITPKQLMERICCLYPTFPIPSDEMNAHLKRFRERGCTIKTVGEFKLPKKKKLKRHENHLLQQHKDYLAKYRPSVPKEKQDITLLASRLA